MKYLILTALIVSSLVFCSKAAVKVKSAQQVLSFEGNPRLTEVLSTLKTDEASYWTSAQLYRVSANNTVNNRINLINMLASEGKSDSSNKAEYQSLINQIKSWDLAARIEIEIDYDRARIDLAFNPKFEDGNYLIKLGGRPTDLFVFGLVDKPSTVEYVNNKCLSDVLASFSKSSFADRNYIYLISPAGSYKKVDIAYWNEDCVLAVPGSQIFIPLRENQIFKQNTKINHAVAELAKDRIFDL